MTYSAADIIMAKKKMRLKSANYCLSFVSTIWKGEVIMCCLNNLSQEICNIFCCQELQPEEISKLEDIINEFIFDSENIEIAIDKP